MKFISTWCLKNSQIVKFTILNQAMLSNVSEHLYTVYKNHTYSLNFQLQKLKL